MEYKNPAVTVDSIVLKMTKDQLEVLVWKRDTKPYIHQNSLIGGFVKYGETVDKAAQRILASKAKLYLKKASDAIILPIVSDDKPDVRGWIFTVPVLVMVKEFEIADSNLKWQAVSLDQNGKLVFDDKLAFDHNHVLEVALQYLRNQLLLHNYQVLQSLLPETFTSRELYNAVYMLTGMKKTLSNFMRESAVKKAIERTGERVIAKSGGPSGQPARLYVWNIKDKNEF